MLATKNTYIQSAYNQLQIISQDRQKRLEYEAREKAVLDYNQLMLEAEQRGEARGEARGMERGEKLGMERGEKLGMERINTLNMILIQEKRYNDLERSAKDIAFQQEAVKNSVSMGNNLY